MFGTMVNDLPGIGDRPAIYDPDIPEYEYHDCDACGAEFRAHIGAGGPCSDCSGYVCQKCSKVQHGRTGEVLGYTCWICVVEEYLYQVFDAEVGKNVHIMTGADLMEFLG
ncbi:hypothetical protein OAF54_02920 [bacterium]|nr:hypothetical protein [bacterium]